MGRGGIVGRGAIFLTVRHMPKNEKQHKKAFQPARGRRKSNALKLSMTRFPPKQKMRYRTTAPTGNSQCSRAKSVKGIGENFLSNGVANSSELQVSRSANRRVLRSTTMALIVGRRGVVLRLCARLEFLRSCLTGFATEGKGGAPPPFPYTSPLPHSMQPLTFVCLCVEKEGTNRKRRRRAHPK